MKLRLFIVGGIWTLLHLEVGRHVLAGLAAGVPRALGWVAVMVVAWLPLAALVAGRRPDRPGKRALEWAGYVAMGLSSMLIVFFLVSDLLHVSAWGFGAQRVSLAILAAAAALTVEWRTWTSRCESALRSGGAAHRTAQRPARGPHHPAALRRVGGGHGERAGARSHRRDG